MNVGAIILAAGSSTRMGQSKQLLPVEGTPLLVKTANTIIAVGIKKIICVLGANEIEHERILKSLPVKTIHNPDWNKGMGSSLKTGIKAFTNTFQDSDAVIVCVCDQPLLSELQIHRLINKAVESHKAIVASAYAGTVGVPVLFTRSFFDVLANVADDAGAKKVIASHADQLATVDFPEGAIDLDTPEDYTRFKNKHPHS